MSYAFLANLMRRESLRASQSIKAVTQAGLISAYDPDKYAVKVRLMPEDIETAWIPMLVEHVGNEFGVLIGPEIDDQVLIGFADGDRDAPYIIARLHSDEDKPPRVEAGEILVMHKSKGFVKIDKKETITVQHKKKHRTIISDEDGVAKVTTFLATNDDGDQGHSMVLENDGSEPKVSLTHVAGHTLAMDNTRCSLKNKDGSLFTFEGGGVATLQAKTINLDGEVTLGGRKDTRTKPVARRDDATQLGDKIADGDSNVWVGTPSGSATSPDPAPPDPPLIG